MAAFRDTSPQYPGSTSLQTSGETGWIDRLMNPKVDGAAYQELKFALHRKLLGRVHLEVVLAQTRVQLHKSLCWPQHVRCPSGMFSRLMT